MTAAGARRPPARARAWLGWGALALGVASLAAGTIVGRLPLGTPYKQHLAAGMLQLVLLTLGVGAGAAWLAARAEGMRLALRDRTARLVTAGAVAAYAAGLSALSIVRHRALLTGTWDLGHYANLMWDLTDLRFPSAPIAAGRPLWNHATFILLVPAPLLRLVPTAATLLVLQSLVLALGAVPAFSLGRRLWGYPWAGPLAAGVYLLYPPLQFTNLFDFHADAFATPLLLAAFAALLAGRSAWALGFAASLLLVKEDMALVAGMFGLYVAIFHRRWPGLLLAAGSAAAFVLFVGALIPGWIGTPYFAVFNRWPHLGNTPWELIASPVLRPAAFFGTVLHPERLGYLVLLVTPLAGLPLLAPEILAIGLPPLASNLLSTAEGQYSIRAHYTATLTPILVAAAIVGAGRAGRWLSRHGVSPAAPLAALAATSLAASLAFSPLPWSLDPFARKQFWKAGPRGGVSTVGAHIPADAGLSAANHLGGHFALRQGLWLFPQGMDAADLVLVDVDGLDYVGAAPDPEAFRPLLQHLVETRPLVALDDGLALFGRGAPSPDAIARLARLRAGSGATGRRAGALTLVDASVGPSPLAPRERVRVHYTWARAGEERGMPCVAEGLARPEGAPAWEDGRPMFHGLLDGNAWPVGWLAEETSVAVVPETVPPGSYTWTVATWYEVGSSPCGRPPEGTARLPVARVRILPW